MYRPQIKVLDCTIRDGGLINDHRFEPAFVKKVYDAVCDAGIDYMEIGYKSSAEFFSPEQFGPWKFTDERMILDTIGSEKKGTKLSAMVDVGRVNLDDILPKEESPLDMIRVATYTKDMDKAIHIAHHVLDKGYETTINIMAVSHAFERDLDEALEEIETSRVPVVYIVDSYGALYSEQIQYLARKFQKVCKTKTIGIHAHNNQQLGFANTIEAIICGVNYLDATLYGMGRGAGNCPTELLIGFLKNPKFDLRPLLEVIAEEFIPLRDKLEWGYLIPYMVTGILDEHPRSAIKLLASERRMKYKEFYEELRDGMPIS